MLGMHGTAYANKAICEADLIFNVGSRFDDPDRGAGGEDEGLALVEFEQCVHDGVGVRPGAGGLAERGVDDQFVGVLADFEDILEHAQQGLRTPTAGAQLVAALSEVGGARAGENSRANECSGVGNGGLRWLLPLLVQEDPDQDRTSGDGRFKGSTPAGRRERSGGVVTSATHGTAGATTTHCSATHAATTVVVHSPPP